MHTLLEVRLLERAAVDIDGAALRGEWAFAKKYTSAGTPQDRLEGFAAVAVVALEKGNKEIIGDSLDSATQILTAELKTACEVLAPGASG